MLKNTLLCISILLGASSFVGAQSTYPYQQDFQAAYELNPGVPSGLLEAVSFCQTRMTDLNNQELGCVGLPIATGVMGLVENGQGYFNNTKSVVAQYAGVTLAELNTPAAEIMAYAKAYSTLLFLQSPNADIFITHESTLRALCEIPQDDNPVNNYALSSFTYQIFDFMRDEENQAKYGFPAPAIDLRNIYGEDNLKILASKKVLIHQDGVKDSKGNTFVPQNKSFDFAPALWVATPTCNFSSRSGTAISAVTIHTIQGTYAGAISWAQNCSANVSYHYVVRSTDGQITQMVLESDKGWHVGSENPYTVGIEHEGYVDNPAWYTTSLYTASASLTKDITQSGYGINPLRTFQGPATVGINLLGACTKIKGHQHYPNQSHTDPGINWNWEYYYQLINDSPSITSLTGSTGVLYDSGGSAGNYSDDERELYLIEPASVLNITVSFAQFGLENNWDYMYIYDGTTPQAPLLGAYTGNTLPSNVTSTAGAMLIEFRSDCATQDIGWELNWTSMPGPVPGDVIAPTTLLDIIGNWQTTDFSTNFSDADNVGGSGVHQQFYQVTDFDGTEWRGNSINGFFADKFDLAIHPDWTNQVGTWAITSAVLEQSDELNVNTNIWATLDQDNFDQWLYHFSMNFDGTGGNKRAGFHFMCDDPTLTNRGNSYFIWLRADDDLIQIYKTVNDIFQLEADIPFTVNENQWYDVKTMYDKSTGVIQLYLDNNLEASWTDSSPYLTGNSISLRSGDCNMKTNDLRVYHNRGSSELVTINTANDVQYQNTNPLTPSAQVNSIVIDSAANISSVEQQPVNVDWTSPSSIVTINDGVGGDINVTTTNTELSANWSASADVHSDIARYWYCIGTAALATDVVGWTDNWIADTLNHNGLSLIEGTTYYTCVYAENGAGLYSDTVCTDGQTLQAPTAPPTANFVVPNSYICSFQTVQMFNSSLDAQTYEWFAPGGTPPTSTQANPSFSFTSSGNYDITLIAIGTGGTDTTMQTIIVNIDTIPNADYTPSAAVVDISNAFVTFSNSSQYANGYLWDFDDGSITNDVSPWHEFMAVGDYYVELVAVNGLCPNDTVVQLIQVIDDLAINEQALLELMIYPNPVIDQIQLILNDSWQNRIQIQLYDAKGSLILEEKREYADKIIVNLKERGLTEGVYYIHVSDAQKVLSRKIIVKPS